MAVMLKPGEREAIAAWWSRNPMLQGAVAGFGAGIAGILLGGGIVVFLSAFIDFN